jgi:hypothetical protein
MVNICNYKYLTDEEKSKYKFDFCELCPLYECELIKEYIPNKNVLTDKASSNRPVIVPTRSYSEVELPAVKARQVVEAIPIVKGILSEKTNLNPEIGYSIFIQNEMKNGCTVKGLMRKECGILKVAMGIGDDFKIYIRKYSFKVESDSDKYNSKQPGKWEPNQPVYISAQTGQGKNFFIENTLLLYVRELNYKNHTDQKVLIISNRIALHMQIKNRLKHGIIIQDNDQDEEFFGNYKGYPADVITYQSLLCKASYLKHKQDDKTSRYIFVVCDEAHFFTSDAMFNPDTAKILQTIVKTFKDAIRIYMSATPYECLPYIKEYEENNPENIIKKNGVFYHSQGVFYHFKRDYDYLDIKYYTEFNELFDLIVESVNKKNEKWLIFIDDKDKSMEVKKELEKHGDKCYCPMKFKGKESKFETDKILAVDTSSKKNKDYQDMVLNEKLNKYTFVLISTSVLDNGVNLKGIKNIVVSDVSKVKCLQMVGRARVEGSDDKKNLYLKRFDSKYMKDRIDNLIKQQDAFHDYDLAYNSTDRNLNNKKKFLNKFYNNKTDDWENSKHWFGRDEEKPEQVYPNEIARSYVNNSVLLYKFILAEMQRNDEGQEVKGQNYLEYQLSWFGKKYYKENDLTLADKDEGKKKLIDFLESYADNGKQLFDNIDKDKSEQVKFRREITKFIDSSFGKQDPNKKPLGYGKDKINKILMDYSMDYKVESFTEKRNEVKRQYWKVVRLDSDKK